MTHVSLDTLDSTVIYGVPDIELGCYIKVYKYFCFTYLCYVKTDLLFIKCCLSDGNWLREYYAKV